MAARCRRVSLDSLRLRDLLEDLSLNRRIINELDNLDDLQWHDWRGLIYRCGLPGNAVELVQNRSRNFHHASPTTTLLQLYPRVSDISVRRFLRYLEEMHCNILVKKIESTLCIQIFVTYVRESRESVLTIGHFVKWLDRGCFRVHADVKFPDREAEENLMRAEEFFADDRHVIVCITPRYRHLVESDEYDPTAERLHAPAIYRWMKTEAEVNHQRFVPVLFGGATEDDVPKWLLDGWKAKTGGKHPYRWKEDYLGLHWYLNSPLDLLANIIA